MFEYVYKHTSRQIQHIISLDKLKLIPTIPPEVSQLCVMEAY